MQTPADERFPTFSPDGRWLAYSSSESGIFQVYVRAFPDKGGKWQVSGSGGVHPEWSRNGRDLFFRTEDNRMTMVATYTVKGDSFAADKPRVWSEKQLASIGINPNYDLAPDGKRIAALMPAEGPDEQKAAVSAIVSVPAYSAKCPYRPRTARCLSTQREPRRCWRLVVPAAVMPA